MKIEISKSAAIVTKLGTGDTVNVFGTTVEVYYLDADGPVGSSLHKEISGIMQKKFNKFLRMLKAEVHANIKGAVDSIITTKSDYSETIVVAIDGLYLSLYSRDGDMRTGGLSDISDALNAKAYAKLIDLVDSKF